jgi:hypothetical protein
VKSHGSCRITHFGIVNSINLSERPEPVNANKVTNCYERLSLTRSRFDCRESGIGPGILPTHEGHTVRNRIDVLAMLRGHNAEHRSGGKEDHSRSANDCPSCGRDDIAEQNNQHADQDEGQNHVVLLARAGVLYEIAE